MENYKFGICRHCGQQSTLNKAMDTQEEADTEAATQCDCPGANTERQIKKGQERVLQLFGPDADNLGFDPVSESEIVEHLNDTVVRVAHHQLLSATLNLRSYGKAKIGLTSKSKIKVERSVVQAYQLEG